MGKRNKSEEEEFLRKVFVGYVEPKITKGMDKTLLQKTLVSFFKSRKLVGMLADYAEEKKFKRSSALKELQQPKKSANYKLNQTRFKEKKVKLSKEQRKTIQKLPFKVDRIAVLKRKTKYGSKGDVTFRYKGKRYALVI